MYKYTHIFVEHRLRSCHFRDKMGYTGRKKQLLKSSQRSLGDEKNHHMTKFT